MNFTPFITYCHKHIKGDEKGEAQTFLDHFFMALGYEDGYKAAGADCEYRIKNEKKKTTSFADLVWKPRVLIEMKKRGEDLSIHLQQAFSYWSQLVPNRPNYIILCNFDEFWIYDFNKNIYEPQEKIDLEKLEQRKEAFTFLLPKEKKPLFKTDREEVTADAAKFVSYVYKNLTDKNRNPLVNKEDAMHYCLQCVLCMYAEDIDLLPGKIFTRIIEECLNKEGTGYDKIPETYDLIGGLFKEMNSKGITPAGKYKDVDYFNGGLFDKIIPIELTKREVELMDVACTKNWRHINPAIFGAIFEGNMDEKERHNLGAHYTNEIDIKKIVAPVIVQPWRQKIDDVLDKHDAKEREKTAEALKHLHIELCNYKVLDPACGSGNFLFIAYKELKLIEKEILKHFKLIADKKTSWDYAVNGNYVSTKQFFGIDLNSNAVELAKVTLMIAKEMSIKEAMDKQETLPLDNLDANIICADALFTAWPDCDVIIGNPPFQSGNNMKKEFGYDYVEKVRKFFPKISGNADFCVYWFYKAHNHLKENQYAGLIATNTIRQAFSRKGSLDYIIDNDGQIFNAVSIQHWSGEASVYVSVVNWIKGAYVDNKIIFIKDKNDELERHLVQNINSSLSLDLDVSKAKILSTAKNSEICFQGQMHGYGGFLLDKIDGLKLIKSNNLNRNHLIPFLIGNDLVGEIDSQPSRFLIDFSLAESLLELNKYPDLLKILRAKILPEVEKKAIDEKNQTKKIGERQKHLERWWQVWTIKKAMLKKLSSIKKYIACSRITKYPIFEFVSTGIRPNDKIVVFAAEDDYSFGIIQSSIHWEWIKSTSAKREDRFNYSSNIVWNTFPWPQTPTETQIKKVATAAKALHTQRTAALKQYNMSLRDLYRLLEQPGANPIKDLHTALDKAVMEAYGFDDTKDILTQLLALNLSVAYKENKKEKVQPPGLPEFVKNKESYVSEECVKFEWG